RSRVVGGIPGQDLTNSFRVSHVFSQTRGRRRRPSRLRFPMYGRKKPRVLIAPPAKRGKPERLPFPWVHRRMSFFQGVDECPRRGCPEPSGTSATIATITSTEPSRTPFSAPSPTGSLHLRRAC